MSADGLKAEVASGVLPSASCASAERWLRANESAPGFANEPTRSADRAYRRLAAGPFGGPPGGYQLADGWSGNPGFLAHHQFKEACENGNQSRPEHHRFCRVQKMTEAIEMGRAVIGEIKTEAKKASQETHRRRRKASHSAIAKFMALPAPT